MIAASSRARLRVFITGASTGLGGALARHYAQRGASLGLAARNADALGALASSLSPPAHVYPLDVRNAAALQTAAADFIARCGGVDIVIANAGISVGTDPADAGDLEVFREVVEINVVGMANTLQPFIAAMREARTGTLVGIASVAAYRGIAGAGAYCASKSAAVAYLESVRATLHGTGVRVLTVCPGYIATPMTEQNPYRMPFLMSAETAVAKIAGLVDSGRSYAVIPWQMAIVARVLRLLPNAIVDRVFAGRATKPRRGG
jgi:short-subunit dehydrogenase